MFPRAPPPLCSPRVPSMSRPTPLCCVSSFFFHFIGDCLFHNCCSLKKIKHKFMLFIPHSLQITFCKRNLLLFATILFGIPFKIRLWWVSCRKVGYFDIVQPAWMAAKLSKTDQIFTATFGSSVSSKKELSPFSPWEVAQVLMLAMRWWSICSQRDQIPPSLQPHGTEFFFLQLNPLHLCVLRFPGAE